MKIFNLVDNGSAKYLQLAESVKQNIRMGKLLPGDPLPSVKAFSEDMGLNRHTIMKAFAELIAEGWVESQQRIGYSVGSKIPIEGSKTAAPKQQVHAKFDFRLIRAGTALSATPATHFTYNYSGGQPDLSKFPFNEFKRHMSSTLARPNIEQFSYGETKGVPELIQQIQTYLRKSRSITNRDIIITNGSQEALYIVAQLLLQKGEQVAVEALGYPPAMAVFKNAGANLAAIKQDVKGIIPEDLEYKILNGNIKLIYLTPLHQYPTTVTLPIARRMAVYQLASKYKIPIIEDDYDHEFHYRSQPLAPMASDDPQQLVIYLSTFSKVMFPGARIGILAVSDTLAKAIAEYRMMISHKGNVLMQLALAKWMESGGFERHLKRMTRIYMARRDHAIKFLEQLEVFDFICPDGGMALWVKLKNTSINTAILATQAKQHGIYLQHEKQYHTTPCNNQNNHLRIGFASMPEQKFSEGLSIVANLIAQNK
ncbi:PLP-dependent aminotransferase family protein [Paraglaciecola sp. 2405UD69-4]|uniref:MocR-like pyridoxine biosynthesis transcription factor PdxR n=1 Tax=Paraglaciecola sp. 2405UD69-4 TaxID=3391836 RepID=UPI0039C96F26